MYSNCFTFEIIARELNQKLKGLQLNNCFSSGREDLFFDFSDEGRHQLQLQIQFINGELFSRLPVRQQQAGRKSLFWFKELYGKTVQQVESIPFEREFHIVFNTGLNVVFQGFGRFGNVFLADKHTVVEYFRKTGRSLKPSYGFKLTEQHLESQSTDELNFLSPEMKKILSDKSFNTSSGAQKYTLLSELSEVLLSTGFCINSNTDPPELLRFGKIENQIKGDALTVLDEYAALYARRYHFIRKKNELQQQAHKDLQHYKRLKADNELKIQKIKSRRSYKELGDIVMSHAHSIKPGVANAFLSDFYTGSPIRIKLNPDLSAAENAARFYRKAKNEGRELQMANENLEVAELRIQLLEKRLAQIATATEMRDLPESETAKQNSQSDSLPYRVEEFNGYLIWTGKNARSNDELLRNASKNDMWFHARNVAGSHVLIRSNGRKIPEAVMEHAARLAAKHSKAKTQAVVPVIYTERKFVVKPKSADPGEVRLLKENVMDVFLET